MKEQIEALLKKWIEDERRFRQCASDEAQQHNDSGYSNYMGRAWIIARCRRELQEAAGLVAKQSDI